ncbi:hypothetical protein BMF81_01939 [Nodularia spumigena UHCC 0039]|uniref:Uncharacterized protein n=1 Tax=Nodularia spumigena UHCC 0039 TaxID=1914872 RepID=A0A2S0Q7P6_NODSP|nr:hypothetical protein BMF81_01939 [Nodularia spumigena UHCC 0039]
MKERGVDFPVSLLAKGGLRGVDFPVSLLTKGGLRGVDFPVSLLTKGGLRGVDFPVSLLTKGGLRGVDFPVSPECEDEEDIKDAIAELEDAKINGTLTWEQYKQELK